MCIISEEFDINLNNIFYKMTHNFYSKQLIYKAAYC